GEPAANTSGGKFFVYAPPGQYTLRAGLYQGGQIELPGGGLPVTVTLDPTPAVSLPATGVNESNAVSGSVFDDFNVNGKRESTEAGVPGATVFLDTNRNGRLDPDEISTTTDSSGNYSMSNVPTFGL